MAKWSNSGREECSNLCGKGEQEYIYKCVNNAGAALPESECAGLPGREPPIPCEVYTGCENIWRYQAGKCSNSCGVGKLEETAECVTRKVFEKVDDVTTCGPPPDKNLTREVDCESSTGCQGEWTQQLLDCRATCGNGLIFSNVACVSIVEKNKQLDDDKCPSFNKPSPNAPQLCQGSDCAQDYEYRLPVDPPAGDCEPGCGKSWTVQERDCVRKSDNVKVDDQNCQDAKLNKPGDKMLESYNTCSNFDLCEYKITRTQCSKECGVGVEKVSYVCRNSETLVEAPLQDCKAQPLPKVANIPCTGTRCDTKPCEKDTCEWVVLGGNVCNSCDGQTTNDVSCQDKKKKLVIDDGKCANLQKPANENPQRCQNPKFCESAINFCCDSAFEPRLQDVYPCKRQDGVLLTKKECGLTDFSLEGIDCRDPGVEFCGSSAIDPVLPIVASVVSLVVVGGIIGGVYFFLWNRKRLNKSAQESIAMPFSVIRSESTEPLNY